MRRAMLMMCVGAVAMAGPDAGTARKKNPPKRPDVADHSGRATPYIDRTQRLCRIWSKPEDVIVCGPGERFVCVVDKYEGEDALPSGGWRCDKDVPGA